METRKEAEELLEEVYHLLETSTPVFVGSARFKNEELGEKSYDYTELYYEAKGEGIKMLLIKIIDHLRGGKEDYHFIIDKKVGGEWYFVYIPFWDVVEKIESKVKEVFENYPVPVED